jgi:hypothetical protein
VVKKALYLYQQTSTITQTETDMKSSTILTTTLGRTKKIVLARNTEWGISPYSYMNHKQAAKKVEELKAMGIDAWFSEYDHVKYIYVNQ